MPAKHAYLIMAHGEFALLQILATALDDIRNDLYIHFDAKVADLPTIQVNHAKLHYLEHRIDVRWGDVSQIEAEIALLEAAVQDNIYIYYHLLSGVDLPLKNQDFIHRFFERNAGKEFIGYGEMEMTPELVRKAQRWHLFPRHFRDGNLLQKGLRSLCLRFQDIVDFRRNRSIAFKKGANWVSITDGFARYVLTRKDWIRKTFSHTFCGDEIFMQTICWDSPFREQLFDASDEWRGNQRLIGWKDGYLHDWNADDYNTLASSDALFARKFNLSDMSFIERVLSLSK